VPVGRFENDLEWQLAEALSLENNIRVDVSDLTAVRTETAIKNQLIGALFLKLAVITNYLSDVPAGSDDTDIDTMVNVSYEFD
jgi:putative salt-induced outer membrane protein YdiY